MDSAGPFKATFFWKEMLQFVFSHATFHSKKKKKANDDRCLLGADIVDLIHVFLQRKNGKFIHADDLSRTNAVKVFKKMIEMKILKPETFQKGDETRLYSVSENYNNVESCTSVRDNCLNPRLPSCFREEFILCPKDKKLLNENGKYSTRRMLIVNNETSAKNQRLSNDFMECSKKSIPQKRRSLFSRDEREEFTYSKVKCMRRHSYNLANRHSEIYCQESIPLLSTFPSKSNNQACALARLLYEFEICNLEDILSAMNVSNTEPSSEYAFENKMFAEPASSPNHNRTFVNVALKCLSVIPKDFNKAKSDTDKKILCFHAVKLYYKEKYVIPPQFSELLTHIIKKSNRRSSLLPLDISQMFVQILPVNVQKELFSLLSFIRAGCREEYLFSEKHSNAKIFYGVFGRAIVQNTSLTDAQITSFTRHLVMNQSALSSTPDQEKLRVPRLMEHIHADVMSKESRSLTQKEIKLLLKHIQDSPKFSVNKKKLLMKKMTKVHL